MKLRGFSLLELMVSVVVFIVLVAIVYPSYQSYVRKAHLSDAMHAMLDNAQFLERSYASRGNFKKNSTTWLPLPNTETEHFCIKLQGNPRGTNSNSTFTMKAVAKNKAYEPRSLVLNQDGTLMLCETTTSDCSEQNYFKNSGRADKLCKAYP